MEIGVYTKAWSAGPNVDEQYVAVFQGEREYIYAYLRSIVDGSIPVPHAHALAEMRRGLSQWLSIQNL